MSDTDEVSEYNEIKTPPVISLNSSPFKRQCGCNNDPECCRKSDLNYYHGFPKTPPESDPAESNVKKMNTDDLISLCLKLVKEKNL